MGILNFIVDAGQSSQLARHDDEIEKLKEQVTILKEWVDYLNKEIENIKQGQTNGRRSDG